MTRPTPPAARLQAVGATTGSTELASEPLPPEAVPPTPDLLAALDAGDEEAVWAWLRARTPETESLVYYGLLVAVGVAGLVEWPALALTALGTLIIDRRFNVVESVAAEVRAKVEGRPSTV